MLMKLKDPDKLKKARNIINLLLEGINPIDYETFEDDSFVNNPKMIRIFSYISLVLNQDIMESLEENEKDGYSNELFSKRIDRNNPDYKLINETIKSSKIQLFNKTSSGRELKKLAEFMEKEEHSV